MSATLWHASRLSERPCAPTSHSSGIGWTPPLHYDRAQGGYRYTDPR